MADIIDVVMRLTDMVTPNLDDIRRHIIDTRQQHRLLASEVRGVSRSLGSMADTMMPVAAGIAAVGGIGVKTFMDFDATLTAAGVKAGATAEEMNQMRDVAGKLGAEFPISAQEAAEGMDRLAAGGFDAQQVMAAMPGIIEASVASGEDLAATSDVVTSALDIWNLRTGDVAANTTHVADVIQATANASKMGMQEFGLAMQYAGAPAATLGVSIEELGAAMGVMANNGIEASTIGTSLRSVFSRLADPPKTTAMAFDQLGISVADLQKGDGSFIGLSNAVEMLRGKMQGMSDTQQVAIAKAIAGEDAYSGLLALIRSSPEAYAQVADAINSSTGSSHAAFETMSKTLKGSIDQMKGAAESAAISLGKVLAPQVQSVAGVLSGLATALANMTPEQLQFVVGIGEAIIALTALLFTASKVAGVAATLIGVYGDVGKVLNNQTIRNKALQYSIIGIRRAYQLMQAGGAGVLRFFANFRMNIVAATRAAFGFAFSPIGLALLALAAAAYLVYTNWDKIAPAFNRIAGMVRGAFLAAIERIRPAIIRIQMAWANLMAVFQSHSATFEMIGNVLAAIATVIGGVVVGAVYVLASVLTGVFTAAFDIVAAVIGAGIGVFTGLIDFLTGVFTGDWSAAWNGIVEIFSSIFGGIAGIANGILDGVKTAINAVISGINSISVTIPEWVPGLGGKSFGPLSIPMLANGTQNWGGGPAIINERGAEIVDLPKGTRVIPHDQSLGQAYRQGRRSGEARAAGGINVYISGATINNGGDIKKIAYEVAKEIHYELEKRAINQTAGAV